MIWIMVKGGPVMIPIILASIMGLAIIIDRFWLLFRIRMDAQKFTADIIAKVHKGQAEQAILLCAKYPDHPLAITLKSGLEKRHMPLLEVEKVLERVGNAQVKGLEKYIGGLISIVGIEPLLGFLGTITGLIKAFMAWEKAGSAVTVSSLASGIYEAMITTATGLMIAVPYYLICNFIISRIKYISHELNDSSMQLVEVLSEKKK